MKSFWAYYVIVYLNRLFLRAMEVVRNMQVLSRYGVNSEERYVHKTDRARSASEASASCNTAGSCPLQNRRIELAHLVRARMRLIPNCRNWSASEEGGGTDASVPPHGYSVNYEEGGFGTDASFDALGVRLRSCGRDVQSSKCGPAGYDEAGGPTEPLRRPPSR